VELLRGAPELAVHGAGEAALGRLADADRALAETARRDARAAGLAEATGIACAGATVAGVLLLAVAERDAAHAAMLGLLALASFDAVQPLPTAARDRGACPRPATASWSCWTACPPSRIPSSPSPRPAPRSGSRSTTSTRAGSPACTWPWSPAGASR
jgi:ATP-binding cassette subfamily C protein CydC